MKLLCATTNPDKFGIGQRALARFGIELEQVVLDIDEIQHEDAVSIVKDKVNKAFAALQQPVVVTDDSWDIAALGGFPGPYMKSVDHWFSPDDFIRLMKNRPNRQITLQQYVAYTDGVETVVFTADICGEITKEPHGEHGASIMKVVSLDGDKGRTISELNDPSGPDWLARPALASNAWKPLGEWLVQRNT